jgi:alpha-L-rhamnosidase
VLTGAVAGAAGLTAGLTESACSGGSPSSSGPGPPVSLTVDGLDSPIGLGVDDVFFAWHVADERRGATQSAYRIVVSKQARAGAHGGATVWDSGRVPSASQAFVHYGGPGLATDTAYTWTVQTWDGDGATSPMSQRASFETGLADRDWKAKWITRASDGTSRPDIYTYARTEVGLPAKRIARARAHVASDQQYELRINGTRAGRGQAYCYPDSQYYETLDVAALLRSGAKNAIAAVTSWQGATKGHPAGKPGLIVQISVIFDDGTSRLVTTDGTWRVIPGPWLPGTQRDLEGDLVDYTENIDGPAIPGGWDRPGFDDASWQKAQVLGSAGTAPWSRLVPVRTRIVEQPVAAASLTTLSSGAVVADFGRVFAAVPTVSFASGTAGRLVTMRAGYLLDEAGPQAPQGSVPGQVSVQHGTQHTDMSYSYVQRGGTETFHPFDYLGFRYFQIDDPGEPLRSDAVVALTRHAAVPDEYAASFSSSDPVVDAIFELGRHSALFSAQEQFVDTPTREKGPWLWDGFNESKTAMAAFGEQNLTRKSLLEFAASQRRYWPNGAVNKIYPTGLGALDINEFTEIYPEWVWQYWMHTGDVALLDEVYGVLVKLSDYVQRAVEASTGLVTSLPATNIYYSFPTVTRLNVLGANVFGRTAEVGEVLGRASSEIARQRHRKEALTEAINRRLSRSDGTYADGLESGGAQVAQSSQDTNACAVAYGVAPGSQVGSVGAYVAGLGMQAVPRTATEVLDALCIAGRDADMVRTLTDPTIDGWARILLLGGTFTWEVWEPQDLNGDSMSHGWGSTVLVSIQRWLLGVTPSSAGFATFEVSPPRHALENAKGRVPTPRGPIEVSWSRSRGAARGFSLELLAPPNSKATVRIPARRAADVIESGRPVAGVTNVRVREVADGLATLEVGSGRYRFESVAT